MKFLLSFFIVSSVGLAAPAAAQSRPVPRIVIAKVDNDRDMLSGGGWAMLSGYRGTYSPLLAPITAGRDSFLGIGFFTRGSQVYVDLMRDDPARRWHFSTGPVVGAGLVRTDRVADRRGFGRVAFGAGGYVAITRTGVLTGPDDALSFRLSYVRAIDLRDGGETITPAIDYATPLSRKMLVGLTLSAGYARRDIPLGPRRGWQAVNVTGFTNIALTGDLRNGVVLLLAAGRGPMEGDFAASPVAQTVGDPAEFYGAVGLGLIF